MIDKQELVTVSSFMIANTATIALVGDWIVFKLKKQLLPLDTDENCYVYGGEAYNLFGTICGINMKDIEPIVSTLQILLSINLAFALMLFMLVAFKRLRKRYLKLTALIVLGLSLSTIITWSTNKYDVFPSDVNYYGAGYAACVICSISTLPLFFI